MYRVYLRDAEGRITEGVSHPVTRQAAKQAFSALVQRSELDGFNIAAVLAENKQPVAIHRFDEQAGGQRFWRDRLDDIPFSSSHSQGVCGSEFILVTTRPRKTFFLYVRHWTDFRSPESEDE